MFLSYVCLCIAFVLKNNGISTFSPSGALCGLSGAFWGSLVLSGALWCSLGLSLQALPDLGRKSNAFSMHLFLFLFQKQTVLRSFYAFSTHFSLNRWTVEPLNRWTVENRWTIESLNRWTVEPLNNWIVEPLNRWTMSRQRPGNVQATSRQRPGNVVEPCRVFGCCCFIEGWLNVASTCALFSCVGKQRFVASSMSYPFALLTYEKNRRSIKFSSLQGQPNPRGSYYNFLSGLFLLS